MRHRTQGPRCPGARQTNLHRALGPDASPADPRPLHRATCGSSRSTTRSVRRAPRRCSGSSVRRPCRPAGHGRLVVLREEAPVGPALAVHRTWCPSEFRGRVHPEPALAAGDRRPPQRHRRPAPRRACAWPTAYRIDVYDDDRGTLWMENIIQEPGPWPMERFERAAYLLGRLSARRQPHLVEPLLPRGNITTPGVGLRYYTDGRVHDVRTAGARRPRDLAAPAARRGGLQRRRPPAAGRSARAGRAVARRTGCARRVAAVLPARGRESAEPAGPDRASRTSSW